MSTAGNGRTGKGKQVAPKTSASKRTQSKGSGIPWQKQPASNRTKDKSDGKSNKEVTKNKGKEGPRPIYERETTPRKQDKKTRSTSPNSQTKNSAEPSTVNVDELSVEHDKLDSAVETNIDTGPSSKLNSESIHVIGDEYVEPPAKVAIDLGTQYSGYGFLIPSSQDFKATICTGDRSGKLQSPRVPSVLLLNGDGSFNSFGFEARSKYGDMRPEERLNSHYIEHFKMELYRLPKIHRDATIKDYHNRDVKAFDVFTKSINYFYNLALDDVKQRNARTLKTEDIEWILTLPAIWTDSAKQFMREAARAAGINTANLQLVLEPEAASFLLQETPHSLPESSKYILADLGGGTADICAHELLSDTHIRELYRSIGGDFGGYAVTKAYISFLKELCTEHVWNGFKETCPRQYFDLIEDFERKKITFNEDRTGTITVKMEYVLLRMFKKRCKSSLTTRIQECKFNPGVILNDQTGELTIDGKRIETFFQASVEGIIAEINTILIACNNDDIKTIVLTGGFAESPYVRDRIKNAFGDMTVILNESARMAVLKGALKMGFKTSLTIERRARFTYGFSHRVLFEAGRHPEALKRIRDGKVVCECVFYKVIEVGELLVKGKEFVRKGHNTAKDEKSKHVDRYTALWRSTRPNPLYIKNEPGEDNCEQVGRIIIKCPEGGWPDAWEGEEKLILNETEFKVVVKNLTTNEEFNTNLEFL